MGENIQLGLLNDMMDHVLQGDLSCRIDTGVLDEEHKRLYENICRLLDVQTGYVFEMQAATGKIMSVSEDLTSTLEESGQLSGELYQNAEQMGKLNQRNFDSTVGAIGTIKKLVTHLDDIRASTVDAKAANASAGDAIKGGMSQVFGLIELIAAIEATTKQTVSYVEKFKDSTGRITQILRNVDNIARQTQILSFNASIESKRAGSAGSGFGIIAGAIRDLANESKTEVANIEDVIEVISAELKELTDNIYHDYGNVTKSVESTKTIESNFNHIGDTYSGLSGLIDQIAAMTEVENSLAENVSGEITSVEENSRNVNEGFGTIYESINRQKTIIENLNEQGRFLAAESNSLAQLSSRSASVGFDRESISKLSEDTFALLEREVLSKKAFYEMSYENHKELLDKILGYDTIEAVWSNDMRGKFIYSNPIAGILNAKARDWFKESAAGNCYVSDVYVSAITRRPCITVSMPVSDSSGNIIGVLGADLKIS